MKCLQYGCGADVAPLEWLNYDASPMTIIRYLPFGRWIEKKRGISFPDNVHYGNIVKGFSRHSASCDIVYCSHVLEHLSYDECLIALKNSYELLKPGGIFRFCMPDLQILCSGYIAALEKNGGVLHLIS